MLELFENDKLVSLEYSKEVLRRGQHMLSQKQREMKQLSNQNWQIQSKLDSDRGHCGRDKDSSHFDAIFGPPKGTGRNREDDEDDDDAPPVKAVVQSTCSTNDSDNDTQGHLSETTTKQSSWRDRISSRGSIVRQPLKANESDDDDMFS